MPEGETLEFGREKRCIWCSLPKFGDKACVCDDPSYEMMEQCSRCETWREVDQLHIADGVSEDVVCTARCLMTDGGQSTSDTEQSGDLFQDHRVMDVEVTSNAGDGATIDVNGTELLISQNNRHVPVLAEIWVENEENPIGAINTARGETVALGGIEEGLADRVDEIREMPVEEIPDALEELAYRLNPSGREEP